MTLESLYHVTAQCWSHNLFRENFLPGLFHSKKIIVTIENLYLFFNAKHKH